MSRRARAQWRPTNIANEHSRQSEIRSDNEYLYSLHVLNSFVIYTGVTAPEALDWLSMGLDKLQDLVYNVKSEVN